MKGIVLVSGGMDSLVSAAIAKKECEEIYFIHAYYGQPTANKEWECFQKIASHFNAAKTLKADITYLADIGGSSLTDKNMEIPDYNGEEGVPSTYVPFRNGHLIAIAVSWAEVLGANRIYIGAVEEDSSGYPDCRESFYVALQKAIDQGTKDETKIEIRTPVIHMNKAEIIRKAREMNVPLEYSWSCYRGQKKACGTCDSCVLRINAFKRAGIIDPIPYAIEIDWSKDED